jgi:hypothetical protein
MDLFFLAALGRGKSGGLDAGEIFEIASHITDGDADSWIHAFEQQAKRLDAQAHLRAAKGWTRAAGDMRLKAFAAYRSAWQFANRLRLVQEASGWMDDVFSASAA